MSNDTLTIAYINETLQLAESELRKDPDIGDNWLTDSVIAQLEAVRDGFLKTGDHTQMPKDLNMGLIAVRELEPRGHLDLANRVMTLSYYAKKGEFSPDS